MRIKLVCKHPAKSTKTTQLHKVCINFCIRQQKVEHSCYLPVIARNSTALACAVQKERNFNLSLRAPFAKQSPLLQGGDCFVAKNAPRKDTSISFSVIEY